MSIRMRIYDLKDQYEELKRKLTRLHEQLSEIKDAPTLPASLKSKFEEIMKNYQKIKNATIELNNLYLEILEAKAEDESLLEEAANFDEVSKGNIEFLKRLIELISENMNKDNSNVDFYASQLALSRSTLFRRVKDLTGMNINEFIRGVKLSKSREFLRSGNYTVNQVAAMIGFNSVSYFRTLFKSNFGISTGEYIHHNT
jgi:AraC-like DNA-binding protein